MSGLFHGLFATTPFVATDNSTPDVLRDRRWVWQAVNGGMACAVIYNILTKAVLPHVPLSPHYALFQQGNDILQQLMLGNTAAVRPLLHQLATWNTVTAYVLALILGGVVGMLVIRRHAIAGLLAGLSFWLPCVFFDAMSFGIVSSS